jgi:hypothetical protein
MSNFNDIHSALSRFVHENAFTNIVIKEYPVSYTSLTADVIIVTSDQSLVKTFDTDVDGFSIRMHKYVEFSKDIEHIASTLEGYYSLAAQTLISHYEIIKTISKNKNQISPLYGCILQLVADPGGVFGESEEAVFHVLVNGQSEATDVIIDARTYNTEYMQRCLEMLYESATL